MRGLSFFLTCTCTLLSCGMTNAFAPLKGTTASAISTKQPIDLGDYLSSASDGGTGTMLIFGTYAADFNAVEYAQRLRYYLPKLRECGVSKIGLILNCQPEAAMTLMEQVDLDNEIQNGSIDLFVDNLGEAGRAFGVGRGWLPENEDLNPFLKLFGMLWGLGAWATLPAVIGGYIGNPLVPQPWIEDALAVGQEKGRWPDNALEISSDGEIVNKFTELPLVGTWPRRPLELATLRLQSMMGISLGNWNALAPDEEALEAGVLTQLGGCVVVDAQSGEAVFEWRDPGICAVANFEDIIKKLTKSTLTASPEPVEA